MVYPKVRDWRRYLLGMISIMLVDAWVAYWDYHSESADVSAIPLKAFCRQIVDEFSRAQ